MTENVQKTIRFFLFSTVTTAIFFFACLFCCMVRAESSKSNPHDLKEMAKDRAMCRDCHRQTYKFVPKNRTRTVLLNPDDFVADAVAMCVSCHKENKNIHPVGDRPDYPVPADLPLDGNGRVSCLTCHYTHGSLKSDHQCCSASLLDRLFARKRLRKSFLLRRDNPKGELCKACHETPNRKKGTKS